MIFLKIFIKTSRAEVTIISLNIFWRCHGNLGTTPSIIDLYHRLSLYTITASGWQRDQNEGDAEDFKHEIVSLRSLLFSHLSHFRFDHICLYNYNFCDPWFIYMDRTWWIFSILPSNNNLRSLNNISLDGSFYSFYGFKNSKLNWNLNPDYSPCCLPTFNKFSIVESQL
jgi:hypothetical protein